MKDLDTIQWQNRMERWIYIILVMLFFMTYKITNDKDWIMAAAAVLIFFLVILVMDNISESKIRKENRGR